MSAIDKGFVGTMLWVDLTSERVETTPLELEDVRFWGGPAGLNAKLAYELIPPGADPLGPENVLILGNGPFVGTTVPAASRPVISAKSPQTGQYATSAPGHFSVMMKMAGYDYLIVTGRADRPVVLTLFDDDVRIRDADDLWGMDVYETTDELWRRFPGSWVGCIGPAAENLTVYGCIVFSKYSLAASTGLGTVMGSKGLKAIVARGTKAVRVADPARFMRLAHEVHVDVMSGPHIAEWRELGTLIQHVAAPGEPAEHDGFDMAAWIELYRTKLHKGPLGSPQCPVACKAMLELNGKQFPVTCPANSITLPFGLFRKTDPQRYEEIAECAQLCNRLGLSTLVVSQLIGLSIELWENGCLSPELTDGVELRPGDPQVVQRLIEDVAYRRTPLGDILAGDLQTCLERLGEEARRYPTHKGNLASIDQYFPGLSGTKERPWNAFSFGAIVDPRGPVAQNAYISLMWVPERSEEQIRRYLAKIGVPEEDVDAIVTGGTDGYDVAKATKWVEYYNLILYDVGSCQRSFISKAMPLRKVVELYRAATGLDVDADDLLVAAERALVMQRLFNIREGLTRELEIGGTSHREPEHVEQLHRLLDEYYAYHGWTLDGVPTDETLERLELERYAGDAVGVG
jgi:aldehyde:ferredoxin oxidoreductase